MSGAMELTQVVVPFMFDHETGYGGLCGAGSWTQIGSGGAQQVMKLHNLLDGQI